MPKNTGQSVKCKACGEVKPPEAFHLHGEYLAARCRECVADAKRHSYHTNRVARGRQIAHSVSAHVKRKFPASWTPVCPEAYLEHLINARCCHYCAQPNDGTHVFNLDHHVPLALGGMHALDNLVPCCEPCNRAKHDMGAEAFIRWLDGVATRRVQILAQASD